MFKKILSLVLVLALAAALCVGFASCGGNNNDEKLGMSESPLPIPAVEADFEVGDDFKIGFICLHDTTSTYDKNFIEAAKRYQAGLGLSDDQVIIVTDIPETEACYNAAVDLVSRGCDIIFANSFGHENFILQAAREYPDVQFCHATGNQAATAGVANFHNAFASIYEGRYLAGIAAGLKLNEMIAEGVITAEQAKIGYVGAYTYAEVISGYSSFYLGAKSVCPSVTMEVQFTGSWFDVNEEQNAAEALIARKCVLISQHADSMGAPGACEAAGIPNISYNGSTYEACKNSFIVSSAINWTPYYTYITKCVVEGTAIDADWCGGIAEGSVVLSGINLDVAAEGTVDAISTAIAGFKAGTLNVFDTTKFTVTYRDSEGNVTSTGNTITSKVVNGEEIVVNGIFNESDAISAPYFDYEIDGITRLNAKY